jgi:hypothetical protein
MSNQNPNADLSRAATAARQFSSGLARTLARGANSRLPAPGMPSPFAPGGGIARPQSFPLHEGSVLAQSSDSAASTSPLQAQRLPPNSAAGDTTSIRRSQTQMAAVLARAVAQGQRNL